MRLAGHLARHEEILTTYASASPLGAPTRTSTSCRPHLTFVDILRIDSGLDDSKEINMNKL
jgi:hypothetical protein